jgi:UDP-N-acetylglucosamine diphosphorylase / glucose-1-phosphate thymidylyltransferase / UDP-N-acetylgalactosamine diphosphorylase / glucosamine-1-phosphate N-acetyltransferase / galactosamine-1-phosphate N-acetyltransferase
MPFRDKQLLTQTINMSEFAAARFFDLAAFKHATLFSPSDPVWKAIELLESYLQGLTLGSIEIDIPSGVHLVDPHLISIGAGSVIEPGAYIKGPCVIGKECTIRHGAYIRGNLVAGDRCVIGHDTEIKNSILFDGAHAAHFAYVGDSILGNRVNLGAGVKCANFKFDGSQVIVKGDGKVVPTGRRKLGAIIGDDAQIGCNAVLNPGTLVGKRARCYPTVNVGGIIPQGAFVKPSAHVLILPAKDERALA